MSKHRNKVDVKVSGSYKSNKFICITISLDFVHSLSLESSLGPIGDLLHLTTIKLFNEQNLKLSNKTCQVDSIEVEIVVVAKVKYFFYAKGCGFCIHIAISSEIAHISLKSKREADIEIGERFTVGQYVVDHVIKVEDCGGQSICERVFRNQGVKS